MIQQDKDNHCDDCSARINQKKDNGLLMAVKAVFWSFLGIRKRKDLEADMQNLNMVTVAVTGVSAMILFIALLLVVVHFVVAK